MKKIFLIPMLLLLIVTSSCKKEPLQTTLSQDEQMLSTENGLSQRQVLFGTCADWQITLFKYGFIDVTRNYRQVKLTFCPEKTVVLHNDILAINGHWYMQLSQGNPQYLVLDFGFPNPETGIWYNPTWAQLQGTWQILSNQYNTLRLRSVSGNKSMVLQNGSF